MPEDGCSSHVQQDCDRDLLKRTFRLAAFLVGMHGFYAASSARPIHGIAGNNSCECRIIANGLPEKENKYMCYHVSTICVGHVWKQCNRQFRVLVLGGIVVPPGADLTAAVGRSFRAFLLGMLHHFAGVQSGTRSVQFASAEHFR